MRSKNQTGKDKDNGNKEANDNLILLGETPLQEVDSNTSLSCNVDKDGRSNRQIKLRK